MCVTISDGKRISRGLGGFPELSLEAVRKQAAIIREAAREGRDVRAQGAVAAGRMP